MHRDADKLLQPFIEELDLSTLLAEAGEAVVFVDKN